jgi:peptide deformylase
MTARRVIHYPDERLRSIAEPVTEFGDNLKSLVQDMVDTIEVQGGAGLAAPQINVAQRVLVIKPKLFVEESPDTTYSPESWVLVNPVVRPSGEEQRWPEACLSVPMGSGNVVRHEECEVKYQRLDGSENTVTVKWPLSGALQHENDHLNGILYIDHVGHLERSMIVRKIEKMRRQIGHLAEARREQEILDLRGPRALQAYRARRAGQAVPEKKRDKPGKKFGKLKKQK